MKRFLLMAPAVTAILLLSPLTSANAKPKVAPGPVDGADLPALFTLLAGAAALYRYKKR